MTLIYCITNQTFQEKIFLGTQNFQTSISYQQLVSINTSKSTCSYNQLYMKEEKSTEQTIRFGRDIGIQEPDFIPAELHYIYAYAFTNYDTPQNSISEEPLMLTYDDGGIPFSELLHELQKKKPPGHGQKYTGFSLSNGWRMDRHSPVGSLSKITKTTRNDGILLFAEKTQFSEDEDDQDTLVDECAIQTHYQGQMSSQQLSQTIAINFQLPGQDQYVITISISEFSTIGELINTFYKRVWEYFGVELTYSMILKLPIKKIKKNGQIYEEELVDDLTNFTEKHIVEFPDLINNCTLKLMLKPKETKDITFKRKFDPQGQMITIIKEDLSKVKFFIEKIEFMTFGTLYKQKLAPSKKSKGDFVCLKVMDIIITEQESLSKISEILKKKQSNEVLDLVGRVVTEKMYFYKAINELKGKPQINLELEQYIEPNPQRNQKQQEFRTRIRERIRGISEKNTVADFKDIKNVEPIYIYTCEDVHHRDEADPNKTQPVYKLVNKNLREDYIFNKSFSKLTKDWRYLFTSSLLESLSKIKKSVRQTVYRATGYDPHLKKGDITTFKPFTSTTTSFKATVPFQKGDCTIFEMNILNGKPIFQFSQFSEEDEVLLEPYTQFLVTNVIEYPQESKIKRRVFLEQLDEKQSSSSYPKSVANIIFWIDDKEFFEGEFIYKEIAEFEDPTILIHFTSTQQLKDYLQKERTKSIMMDPTADILFITNMTREGNGMAGIEGIIEFQKYQSNKEIPIFMFLWNVEAALEKIGNNKNKLKNWEKIKVGREPKEVQEFIKKAFGKKGKEELPKMKSLSGIGKSVSEPGDMNKKGKDSNLTKSMDYNSQPTAGNSKGGKEICCVM